MKYDRREFLIGAAGMAVAGSLSAQPVRPGAQQQGGTRLVLLGTKGGPALADARKNPATLVVIKGTPCLIDCGYGASRQLYLAGIPPNQLRHLFITHHHSDHVLDFGAVVYNAWTMGRFDRLDIYGPPGLQKMTDAFFESIRFDIETRIVDEGRPDLRKLVFIHEFDRPGVVLQNDDVKVTSALVHHGAVKQAYAYRFDAADRSVVLSGDTSYWPELASFSKGVDVLVHEVMYLPALANLLKSDSNATRLREHLLESHTSCEDVGKIAAEAEAKLLVLSHFVPGGDDAHITDLQWTEDMRKHYQGPIIVGKDLMEI